MNIWQKLLLQIVIIEFLEGLYGLTFEDFLISLSGSTFSYIYSLFEDVDEAKGNSCGFESAYTDVKGQTQKPYSDWLYMINFYRGENKSN